MSIRMISLLSMTLVLGLFLSACRTTTTADLPMGGIDRAACCSNACAKCCGDACAACGGSTGRTCARSAS